MSAESARRYWIDHFSSRDADLIADFVSLTAADCLPLLEDLGLPRADGVDYESAENRVFGFGDVVLKFFRPGRWSMAALQDEVDFLNDLLDDGLAVVRPIGSPGTWRGIHYLQYERVAQPFDLDPTVLTPPSVRAYTHLLAHLHRVGARRIAKNRPVLEPVGTCRGLLEVVRHSGLLPEEHTGRYAELIAMLTEQLSQVTAGVPMQRIHNDPGSWNVLWRPEGPLLMDLDDFDVGPVAVDLAVMHFPWRLSTLPEGTPAEEKRTKQRAMVLSYYREVAPFPEAWESMFEPLRTLRGLYFDAWFAARWHQPAFAKHYPEDNPTDPAWWAARLVTLTQRLTDTPH